ncbi:MAG: hypothetical protein QM775_16600 [Pirellulales bacterium]
MTPRQHALLLATIAPPHEPDVAAFTALEGNKHLQEYQAACAFTFEGRFILSGYPSQLYDDYATRFGWRVVDVVIDNKASGKATKEKKTERLWFNYDPPDETAATNAGAEAVTQ